MRKFNLWLYLALVYLFSWPFFFLNFFWADTVYKAYICNGTAMLMVGIATFIYTKFITKEFSIKKPINWGKPKHYLWVIALAAFLWLVPNTISYFTDKTFFIDSFSPQLIAWIITLLTVTIIFGFGEEFGWRAYLLPKLAEKHTPRKAIMIHAFIWWSWHLPMVLPIIYLTLKATEMGPTGVILGTIAALAGNFVSAMFVSVVFAYVWVKSQSLAVTSLFHGWYDGFRDAAGSVMSMGAATSLLPALFMTLLGIYFLWKGNWKNLAKFHKN